MLKCLISCPFLAFLLVSMGETSIQCDVAVYDVLKILNDYVKKKPYKQLFIARSEKCATNPLSKLLISTFTAVKESHQSNHDTCYSRSGINLMWAQKIRKIVWKPSKLDYYYFKPLISYYYSSYSVEIPTQKLYTSS